MRDGGCACRLALLALLLLPLGEIEAAGQQGGVLIHDGLRMDYPRRDESLRRPGVGLWILHDSLAGDTLQVEGAFGYRAGHPAMRTPYQGHGQRTYTTKAYGAVVGALNAWGKAQYEKGTTFGRWGTLMAHPELFYPYLLADTATRRVDHEAYALVGYMGVPLPGGMAVGIGGAFTGASCYATADPRPRNRVGDLQSCLSWSLSSCRMGLLTLEGRFRRYSEMLGVNIEQERRADMFYRLLGHGLYDRLASETKSSIGQENYLYGWDGIAQWRWRELVTLFVAYRGHRGHGEALQVARLSLTDQQEWEGGLALARKARGCVWMAEISYQHVGRIGTEIYYDTVSVSQTPRILEHQEFARVPKWIGEARLLQVRLGAARQGERYYLSLRYQGQYGHLGSRHTEPRLRLAAGVLWQQMQLAVRVAMPHGLELESGLQGAVRLVYSPLVERFGAQLFPSRAYDALALQLQSLRWMAAPSLALRAGKELIRNGAITLSFIYTRNQRIRGEGSENLYRMGLRYDM